MAAGLGQTYQEKEVSCKMSNLSGQTCQHFWRIRRSREKLPSHFPQYFGVQKCVSAFLAHLLENVCYFPSRKWHIMPVRTRVYKMPDLFNLKACMYMCDYAGFYSCEKGVYYITVEKRSSSTLILCPHLSFMHVMWHLIVSKKNESWIFFY